MMDGFEHQYTPPTSVNTATWIPSFSNSTNVTYVAGRLGGKALSVEEDGVNATYARYTVSSTKVVMSVWVKFTPPPSGASGFLRFTGGAAQAALLSIDSTGHIQGRFATGTIVTTSGTYNDGNWHLIDVSVDTGIGVNYTMDWAVDGVAQTQVTLTGGGASTISQILFGSNATSDNATILFDDFIASYTTADYPLGGFAITNYNVTADGTHNDGVGGNFFNESSTQASMWTRLDNEPPLLSQYVYQFSANSTQYAEWIFADTTLTPVYVQGMIVYTSSGTTTNSATTKVVTSGGTDLVSGTFDMSEDRLTARQLMVTPPSGGWTTANFNSTLGRFGYATDVSPQPRWHYFALQIAVVDTSGAVTLTKTHTTNAIVKATLTRTHTTDAIVKKTATKTHTSNAIVLKTQTKTHTTNAFITSSFSRTHTTNATVLKTLTKTHTTNAIVKKTLTKTHTTNAYIGGSLLGQTKAHSTDALILDTIPVTHTTDATLLKTIKPFHRTTAIIRATITRTHATDAYIALSAGPGTRVHATDAIVSKAFTRTHTTDAIRLKTATKTHTTNAVIGSAKLVSHTTDASVKGIAVKRTHATDAYVAGAAGAGGWQIDLYGATGTLTSPVATNVSFKSASITWALDGSGSAQVELVEDDTATNWLSGQRRVTFARGGARLFTGYLTQVSAQSQGRPHTTVYTMSLMGLGSMLDWRVVHGDFNQVATVGTTIAWNLINHANTQESMGFTQGITVGTADTFTRYYCDGDVIAESINELAQRDSGGFDWEINADGKFNAWVGGRGTDKSATYTIALNDTTTDAIQWREQAETSDVVTYVTAMGVDPDGPCGPPLTVENIALSGYPRREVVVSGEHNTQDELEDAALDELKARQKARYRLEATWHVDDLPWAFGPTGVWLGDVINVTPNTPFGTTQKVRLIEVGLSLEKGATEWMTYTFEMAT